MLWSRFFGRLAILGSHVFWSGAKGSINQYVSLKRYYICRLKRLNLSLNVRHFD